MSHGKVVTDADTDTDQADAAHSLLPGAEPDLGQFRLSVLGPAVGSERAAPGHRHDHRGPAEPG
ncbi:hypothetical protein KXD97_02075 [Mycobacterium sp. SMC-8]|uniref:hypothetical protein n=1 Tax=Mycobacterium sp. SMC-8 TaxID=2857060 RepID=UPI0021B1BD9B|nr:hypothetical protein [Mycobacterium sp. SMC-8]UXA12689.1 hypothetical protein KXD97_02075 [Mycobacterium sp. SMC-8]